jgi:hypothetical protein
MKYLSMIEDSALASGIKECGANYAEEIVELDVRKRGIKTLMVLKTSVICASYI